MEKQRKMSLAAIVLGYIFLVLAFAAVIFSTIYFINDNGQKQSNAVIESIFLIFWIAIIILIAAILTAAGYGTIMLVKATKLDKIYPNKRTKIIDLVAGIISWLGAIIASGNFIASAKNGNGVATYVVFMVIIDVVFISALVATIIDTIDYKKAKKTIFAKQPQSQTIDQPK